MAWKDFWQVDKACWPGLRQLCRLEGRGGLPGSGAHGEPRIYWAGTVFFPVLERGTTG